MRWSVDGHYIEKKDRVTNEVGKYIPPHLRKPQLQRGSGEESQEPIRRPVSPYGRDFDSRGRDGYYSGGYNSYRDSSDQYGRYGPPRDDRGVHSTQNYFQPRSTVSEPRASRWDVLDRDPEPRRPQGRRGYMTNELGFHGSMNPSRLMEKELFDSSDHVTEGINFDNVISAFLSDA